MFASEKLVADHLDALHVDWEYEPKLFVIEADEKGNCTAGFRPDFFLPEYDLYIEVTMAKVQTLKNRKLRQAAERYPHVVFHLFTRADFFRPRERLREILDSANGLVPLTAE